MVDVRRINERISVAPQLAVEDVSDLPALGYRTLMNNRPDGEASGQPASEVIGDAARKAGLEYIYLPVVSGQVTQQNVEDFGRVLREAQGPILAFCRTGTRCTNLWALAEAGKCSTDEILDAASKAGYDLRGLAPVLESLAASREK